MQKKDSLFPFLLFSLLIHAGLFASMCQIKPPIKTQKQLNEEKIKFVEMEVLIVEKMNDDKSKESEILKIKPDENFISKTKEAKKENKKPSIKKIEKKAPNTQESEKIKNSTKEPIAKTIESNFQENENIEKNSEDNQDENPNITTQECSLAPNVSQYKEHISARDEFLKEIWKKVRSNLNYPIQARKMKFSGETTVRFEVDLNGEVVKSSLKVEKSSGKVILDNSALYAVFSSSPFENNSHLPIDILVPIAFKLN